MDGFVRSGWCKLAAIGVLISLSIQPTEAVEQTLSGPFTDAECVACHNERDPDLVGQWRSSPHAESSATGCGNCHGNIHEVAAATARAEHSCINCHRGAASHSYSSSKHGVINQIEGERQSWQQPLRRGNYRAPSCAYCHLHDGDHGDSMSPHRGPELVQWICAGCHSPRYVREQFASGRRQLEIAQLKTSEGEELLNAAVDVFAGTRSELQQRLNKHRKNVLLGIGHQSPDYQWWYGQPALDGDLIRIRDAIGKTLGATQPEPSQNQPPSTMVQ